MRLRRGSKGVSALFVTFCEKPTKQAFILYFSEVFEILKYTDL